VVTSIAAASIVGIGIAPALADVTIDWSKRPPEGARVVRAGAPHGQAALQVDAGPGGLTLHLATIERPHVTPEGYSLVGQVRYRDVGGSGVLEMWSVFASGSRFFSRTAEPSGPQAILTGTAGWREFRLPYRLDGAARPIRLDIDLVLPASGTVWLGPLELTGLSGDTTGAWWNDRTAGLIGGLAGSLLGVLGAGVGVMTSRGRGRRLVLGLTLGMIVAGAGLLAVLAVEVVASQPFRVVYPTGLIGLLCVAGGLGMRVLAGRRYSEQELRKIQAEDLRPTASRGS